LAKRSNRRRSISRWSRRSVRTRGLRRYFRAVSTSLEDGGELLIQFAINTYGQRAHPLVPGGFEIDIDVDMDGTPDSFMLLGQLAAGDGRTVVFVVPPGSDKQEPAAFADSDLNSANMIMTAPLVLPED
jgi:hypothetical protein